MTTTKTMKHFAVCAFALLLPLPAFAATPSKVVKIVVFPDRALVTREAKVACGKGVRLELEALPPAADGSSFRAAIDRGTVDGLRTESRTRVDAFAPKVRELDTKLEALQDQLRELADAMALQNAGDEVAASFGGVGRTLINREMVDNAANSKAWQSALDFQLEQKLKAIAERAKIANEIREQREKLDELSRQRLFMSQQSQQREWVAELLVSCPAGENAKVQLHYMVGGAGWSPAYEARAAKDDTSFELTTYATVTQSTGEDWIDAQVILSTALPRQNATPPELSQLNVYADPRQPPKKVIVSREGYRAHAEAGDGANQPEEPNAPRLAARDQGLSVQLEIPESSTVRGDATPQRLRVGATTMKSQLKLRTAPRLLPYAFRVAESTNQAPFPLLPGPIDVYRGGGFMARYDLERVAKGARFTLTFGIEERIKIRRSTVAELKRDQGVLGPTRRRKFHYKVEIESYLNQPEEIEITEQVPVSELDDVKIGLDGTSAGYDFDKNDGLVRWRPKLGGGQKQTLDLMFYIDVPASYDTSGN